MATRERYRELLEKIRLAHRAHKETFRAVGGWQARDSKGIAAARKTLDEFNKQLSFPYTTQLEPLRERFLKGETPAIDEIIVFLEVDVPAFGSGYNKEWYLKMLKKVPLSEEQIKKLQNLALVRCASNEYRREDSELRRLMIRLANVQFLNQVAAIPSRPQSRVEGHKRRMIQTVLNGRKDLRDQLKIKHGSKS